MADYQEKIFDLSALQDKAPVVTPGQPVDSVYINGEVPAGVTLKLHAGSRVGLQVKSFTNIELCPPETQGIFISTVGVAAAQLSIVTGTGVYLQGA